MFEIHGHSKSESRTQPLNYRSGGRIEQEANHEPRSSSFKMPKLSNHFDLPWPTIKDHRLEVTVICSGEGNLSSKHRTHYGLQLEKAQSSLKQVESLLLRQFNSLVANISVEEGEYLIVRCGNLLCRAVVIEVISPHCVRCLCIDYGHFVWVSPEYTYELDVPVLRELPWMAFNCVLTSETIQLQPGRKYSVAIRSRVCGQNMNNVYVVDVLQAAATGLNALLNETALFKPTNAAEFLLTQSEGGVYSLARVSAFLFPGGALQTKIELDDTESSTLFPVIKPPAGMITVQPVNFIDSLHSGDLVLVLASGQVSPEGVLSVTLQNYF